MCHNTGDHPDSDPPSNSPPKSCEPLSGSPHNSGPPNSGPLSSDPSGSGSSISISTENSPVTVQQESPQSVGMELASIASDSHLVLDRYWRDSFDSSSSSSSSNTTVSESGMHLNLCSLIHKLVYSSYVQLFHPDLFIHPMFCYCRPFATGDES